MSPMHVFVRALLKSSAICLGVAIAVIQPSIDGSPSRPAAAHESPSQGAIAGLVSALNDSDPGVRRSAAVALGELRSAQAIPALLDVTRDENVAVRAGALEAVRLIDAANPATLLGRTAADALPEIGRAFGIQLTRQ